MLRFSARSLCYYAVSVDKYVFSTVISRGEYRSNQETRTSSSIWDSLDA